VGLISEFCVLRTSGLESFEITSRVVSRALFPASKQDADPLKSDGANGGVMALTVKALLCIMSLGPGTGADGLAGKLVERLAQEFWACPANMSC
jgi:hypothetical protein